MFFWVVWWSLVQSYSVTARIPNHQYLSAPDIQPLTSLWLNDPGSSKEDDPPLTYWLAEVNSSLTLRHNTCVINLSSSHHVGILSSHIITRRVSSLQYDTLRYHIHISFITVYCYNCYILWLVVVNLLLCLIYKLNFIIGMYV